MMAYSRPLAIARAILLAPVRVVQGVIVYALHPARRRSGLTALSRVSLPTRILFMCHGNICRSPYAAAFLTKRLAALGRAGITVESAGFIGGGRTSPSVAIEVASRAGVDMRYHVSRILTNAQWERCNLVVVMEPRQRADLIGLCGRSKPVVVLGDLDPRATPSRAIADPVEQPAAEYEKSYRRIERCIEQLLSALPVSRSQPTSQHPVA